MSGLFTDPFYNRVIRKTTTAFGSLFSGVQFIRYNKAGTIELERQTVPIVFGEKEKWFQRTKQDTDLTRSIQIQFPRFSFSLTGLIPDPSRKQNSLIQNRSDDGLFTQYMPVPYDFQYTLSLAVKNIEDGAEIIEQILPAFNLDYTLSLDLIPEIGQVRDVPIVLESVTYTIQDEGEADPIRLIVWDLTFNVKGYLYGPVQEGKVILKANTYFYDMSTSRPKITALLVDSGFGNYKENEFVFQGNSFQDSTTKATVVEWDPINLKLYVSDVTGNPFSSNVHIVGNDSNADHNLRNYYISSNAAAMSYIHVEPLTANANDSWTAVVQIKEAPNIP